MLILAATTDKLQLLTSAAVTVDVHASWADLNAGTVTPGKTNTAITTATTTDIVAAPASSTQRNIQTLVIRNKDAASAVDVTVIFDQNGTDFELHKVTLNAGQCLEYLEGVGFFTLSAAGSGYGDVLERIIDADQTGTNGTAAQNWFPTLGAVQVEAGVVYEVEGMLNITRSAGATSHTTSLLFAGTATVTYILWQAILTSTDAEANGNANITTARVATATVIKAASTSATESYSVFLRGTVKINAAGTFIPQFSYSAAPGGAPTIRTGSYFRLIKKGAAFATRGTWS